ncbi:hypothetical protein [Flavivirga algicola]|uniref:Uncharacterized protein n=1 Tax=Flavivirga algicola TaxID=2729136 RepID=A0ABX1S1B8_9FLAO|nr:hypothetical protein [Flavivirga algicola]NMH89627.1 hypothetical protein [Flavivirga algicola]
MKKAVIFTIVFFTSLCIRSQEFTKKVQLKKGQAKFGKAFVLSMDEILTIGNKDDLIEVEITDWIEEWGYDAPPEDPNRNYFSDVQYTLKVKVGDVIKKISISSSLLELKGRFSIDLTDYNIIILSDNYQRDLSSIEMIINKKE